MKKTIEFSDEQQGWVKLQRGLLDTPIIKNPILLQIYIWCLLKANHQPKWFSFKIGKGKKELSCNVGQFITGRKRAVEELGMPESTYYKNIKRIEEYGFLKIESNNHYSIVTVVNYRGATPIANQLELPNKKPKVMKATTKEQPKDTNYNYEKEKKENNKNKYSIFFDSNIFNSLKKDLQNEYLHICNLIENQYRANLYEYKPLKPTQFKLLRRSNTFNEIISSLELIEKNSNSNNIKSLYLHIKNSIKANQNPSTISNEPNLENDFTPVAFNRLKRIIADKLPNVASIPQQLTLETFKTIFNTYDWDDILKKIEELEKWEYVKKPKSLNKILTTFLYKDKTVYPLKRVEDNSFIKHQMVLESKKQTEIDKQKKEKDFQQYFNKVKNLKGWSKVEIIPEMKDREKFVREYLSLVEEMKIAEFPRFSHLSPLTLDEAIRFDDKFISMDMVMSMLDELHNSEFLSKHTSTFEFLKDHVVAINPEGWEDEE